MLAQSILQPTARASDGAEGPRRGARLIFVGGAPRSGTTLVQNILDCHPEICGGPVFAHVPAIVALRNTLLQAVEAAWISAFCSKDGLDGAIAGLIEDLLLPLADRKGCRLLSEKTTANILVFPELMELLPAARFIWVVRDPRAVVSSMLAVGRRARREGRPAPPFTRALGLAMHTVRLRLEAGERARRAAAAERLHLVLYERLVGEPLGETRALCHFLGVRYAPEMLHPSRKEHPGQEAVCGSIWYRDHGDYYRDPDPDRIDAWERELGWLQRARLAAVFGRNRCISALGYRVQASAVGVVVNAVCGLVSSGTRVPLSLLAGLRRAARRMGRLCGHSFRRRLGTSGPVGGGHMAGP